MFQQKFLITMKIFIRQNPDPALFSLFSSRLAVLYPRFRIRTFFCRIRILDSFLFKCITKVKLKPNISTKIIKKRFSFGRILIRPYFLSSAAAAFYLGLQIRKFFRFPNPDRIGAKISWDDLNSLN